MDKAHLYYATDTYCVWCWGMGPSLRTFAKANADTLWIDVIPGGLLTGERVVPIGEKPRAKESAERVAELCKVEFGKGFFDACDEGSTVLDSLVAAKALVAMRELAGLERGLDVAHALQYAWYWQGQDLHEEAVLREIATGLGIDADAALALYHCDRSTQMAEAEFQRRKDLGIKGYPTLLLELPDGTRRQVGGPTSSPQRLQHVFDRLLAGKEPDPDPDEEDD